MLDSVIIFSFFFFFFFFWTAGTRGRTGLNKKVLNIGTGNKKERKNSHSGN